ncbi:hypothetical protein C0991_012262 [Blastosporella zonata]|nr:hypothetical protein C0991_012262 [Blastosporella zonata]
MSVDELKQVGRRTNKLEYNWSLERPSIARAVRSVEYDDTETEKAASILAAIPATSLVVLYEEHDRIVVCDSEGKIPPFSARIGTISRHAHFDEPGSHLIAITVADEHGTWWKLLSIDYGAGNSPSIKELHSSQLPTNHFIQDLFVTTNIVGLVYYCLEDESYSINMMNLIQGFSVNVPMPMSAMDDNPVIFCSVIDRMPFITVCSCDGGDDVYEVYRCPVQSLGTEEDIVSEDVAMEIGSNIIRVAKIIASSDIGSGEAFDRERAESRLSYSGLHILRILYENAHTTTTYASFWPIKDLHSCGPNGLNSFITTTVIDGKIGSHYHGHTAPWLVATSHSGIYSVIITFADGVGHRLCLLQRGLNPPTIHMRTLDVPNYLDLEQIYAVAIEERYGVVYLSHIRGHLFSLPYA